MNLENPPDISFNHCVKLAQNGLLISSGSLSSTACIGVIGSAAVF
jgi:hypothetical protein